MKVISSEIHQLLILLAKRINPSYPNWWSPRDQNGDWLEVGANRCLICNEVYTYEPMTEHVFSHLKKYNLLPFL